MIKIGYGVADFETMVQRGFYYVDRTDHIELLENVSSQYLAFLRPRRFGKSMWISVLQYYYGIQYKEKFDFLFGNYHVGKKPTPEANSYLILRFNFSGIGTETDEQLIQSFLLAVCGAVGNFMNNYPAYFNDEKRKTILQNKMPHDVMREFFDHLNGIDRKVYLLIDEYDHFANELIALRLDTFKKLVTQNGWVRKFYEALKNGANDGVIGRMFITGVSPIMLDSLTS
ncbi:MAG: hypothetical protein RI894_2681, partial [Bacteroidota bacterium]